MHNGWVWLNPDEWVPWDDCPPPLSLKTVLCRRDRGPATFNRDNKADSTYPDSPDVFWRVPFPHEIPSPKPLKPVEQVRPWFDRVQTF